MQIQQPQYLLDLVFNKYKVKKNNQTIYWKECLPDQMLPGAAGYLWVFEDGETFHSYQTPEQVFE